MAEQNDSRRETERHDENREAGASGISRDGEVTHSSDPARDGNEAFHGGEDLRDRDEFTARPNVTEERSDGAIPQREGNQLD